MPFHHASSIAHWAELERRGPVMVSGLTDIVEVATGVGRSYALGRDGRVWQWGKELSPTPVQIKGLGNTVAIWAASRYAYARLEDGSFWGWGEGYGGVLCDGKFDKVYTKPIKTLLTGPIAAMYATQHGVFAWRPDGTLIGCGQHGFNVPNAPRRATAWCRSRCSSGKHPIAMCWRFEPAVPPRRADDLGRRSRLASRSGAKTRY